MAARATSSRRIIASTSTSRSRLSWAATRGNISVELRVP
jgi:hypothetical protein